MVCRDCASALAAMTMGQPCSIAPLHREHAIVIFGFIQAIWRARVR